MPRSRVYRLLRRGEVRVNGKRKQADYRLAADDEVRLPPVREAAGAGLGTAPPSGRPARQSCGAAIVHEDARLLVLDKPAGLAVHGGSGLVVRRDRGAARAAARTSRSSSCTGSIATPADACWSRARGRALRLAHALLREGAVEKHYAALLAGRWRLGRKTIDAPVLTSAREGGERVVRVHRAGKIARLRIQCRRRTTATSRRCMDVAIRTGRTHQIRVHAAFAGHPVAGDEKYGDRECNARLRALGLRRMFLHASSVSFRWPDTGAGIPCRGAIAGGTCRRCSRGLRRGVARQD